MAALGGGGGGLRQRRPPGPAGLGRRAGVSLFHNEGGGRFKAEAAPVPAWPHAAATAAFVDIDHDGDLDVFVAAAAAGGPGLLLRNNGDRTFTDITAAAQLGGAGGAVAVVPTDFDNRRDVDLFVLKRDRPALFKNMRDGSFRDLAAELGLVATGPFPSAAAGDVNKDGYTDFFLGAKGASSFALSDGRGAFQVVPAPPAAAGALAAQFVDYDNDGLLDLLVVTAKGPRLLRDLGASWADVSATAFTAPAAERGDRGGGPRRRRPRRRRRRGRAPGDALRPPPPGERGRQPQPLVRGAAGRARVEQGRRGGQGRDPRRQPAPEDRDLGGGADGRSGRRRLRPRPADGARRGARSSGSPASCRPRPRWAPRPSRAAAPRSP